ncbi:MAG TPA: hypothetical protein VGD64_11420 [Acidisarcina sp.]
MQRRSFLKGVGAVTVLMNCGGISRVYARPLEKPTDDQKGVTFFIYTPPGFFAAAKQSDQALEVQFNNIFTDVGRAGPRGQIGFGFSFPYLNWTEGQGSGPYKIPERFQKYSETLMRVAAKLNVPVMIQFNGAVWHSPTEKSAFLTYWKTVDGGKYLSRYQDGQVNAAISKRGAISTSDLRKYLDADPYGPEKKNSLFFTLSPYAIDFRAARIAVLDQAVQFWKTLDTEYPGVIQAFTTDSEVSTTSFRDIPGGKREIPIGFESWNTKPFCKINKIWDCKGFMRRQMDYKNPLDLKWFEFRAKNHLQFVQDTVDSIRRQFPERLIFTHQISVLDGELINRSYKDQDLASPQWTGFARGANAGFTVYTYGGDRYRTQRRFIDEVSAKSDGKAWGLLEFNTARAFPGSREELDTFTKDFIAYAYERGVRVIAPLSWESNSLDLGIKGSGVDQGIKEFILGQTN